MHIHSSSPNSIVSEEDAATKIQAGFRGYRVRKQLKETHNWDTKSNEEDVHVNLCNSEHKTNGFSRLKSAKSVEEERCATKIQAGIRGYLVRKKQKLAENAAIKIQAGFRGFRTRKQLKTQNQ